MSKLSTDEHELNLLMARVMSAPLAPLRDQGAKLEKGLSSVADESSKSTSLISTSLDDLKQSQKKLVTKLADLEELPEQLQGVANQVEKLREAAVIVDQLPQLLERHSIAQQAMAEQELAQVLEVLSQHLQSLATLEARVIQAVNQCSGQLQERFEHAESQLGRVLQERAESLDDKLISCARHIHLLSSQSAKLQATVLSTDQLPPLLEVQARAQRTLIEQGQQQSVATFDIQLTQLKKDLDLQWQDRLDDVQRQLSEAIQALAQGQGQRLSKSFKWLLVLGLLNVMGLAGCAAWMVLR